MTIAHISTKTTEQRIVIKSTNQAKHPTNATNLSKSAAPQELTAVVKNSKNHLKMFLVHLTLVSTLPLRVKSPFSRMRTAGKSWSGTDSMIASAYRNWTWKVQDLDNRLFSSYELLTDWTILLCESRLTRTTVWMSDPKVI